MPFLGATPDGFAHCDCCGDRLIEIKCPYSVRDKSPVSDEALERSRYCLKKENNVISLKNILHKFKDSYLFVERKNVTLYVGLQRVCMWRQYWSTRHCNVKLLLLARTSL